ncbi:hypothetical protein [Actinoplanes rectilineatus]|nr:hypothetical protein [Actinoplanes rectilineatus]
MAVPRPPTSCSRAEMPRSSALRTTEGDSCAAVGGDTRITCER